jgi:lipopolysaccharide transport system permease protein
MEAKLQQEAEEELSQGEAMPDSEKPTFVIEKLSGLAALKLKEVWEYRELVWLLSWRDISVRYKQTYAGVLWAIIQPLSMIIIFSVVFRRWAGMPSEGVPYPLFSYVAMLPWQYFSTGMTSVASSLIRSTNIVTKVYFPRLIIPLASAVPPLIDFAIGAVVLIVMMMLYGIMPSWHLIALPFLVVMVVVAALGVGIWLAALSVEYRDFAYVTPFLMQFWMFISPVVYPSNIVSYRWKLAYALNPMVGIIDGFRWVFLGVNPPTTFSILMAVVVPAVLLVTGVIYFQVMERTFADVI